MQGVYVERRLLLTHFKVVGSSHCRRAKIVRSFRLSVLWSADGSSKNRRVHYTWSFIRGKDLLIFVLKSTGHSSLCTQLPGRLFSPGIYWWSIILADTDFFQQSESVSATDFEADQIGQALFIRFLRGFKRFCGKQNWHCGICRSARWRHQV